MTLPIGRADAPVVDKEGRLTAYGLQTLVQATTAQQGQQVTAGNVATWLNRSTLVDGGSPSGTGITQLTGDVTAGPGAGSQAATIANDAVTNAKLANMAQSTIKGRAVGAGTGDPTDLTATQATAILNPMVGDSGAGGTKGLAPAPAAGDAAAGKYLKADGTFAVPSGTGAPTGAQYVTLATDAGLSAERVLTAGVGISLTDGGANNPVTVASSIPLVNDGNSGAALTVNFLSQPNARHRFALTGNCTLTFSNPLDGGVYVLLINSGAGSFTVTWPAAVLWPGATAPIITATAAKVDLVTLIYDSAAGKYYGSFNQNY